MYRISDYLTPSERLAAVRFGGLRKLASMGMKPSDLGPEMEKRALNPTSILPLFGTAMRTAIMIGAPIGAVWYAISSSLRNDSLKTKKLKATLDHYNDIAAESRSRIASEEEEES